METLGIGVCPYFGLSGICNKKPSFFLFFYFRLRIYFVETVCTCSVALSHLVEMSTSWWAECGWRESHRLHLCATSACECISRCEWRMPYRISGFDGELTTENEETLSFCEEFDPGTHKQVACCAQFFLICFTAVCITKFYSLWKLFRWTKLPDVQTAREACGAWPEYLEVGGHGVWNHSFDYGLPYSEFWIYGHLE